MTTVGTERVQTPHVDAGPKVTGRAIYTEDLPLPPGTLYGAILRSPYAHARLVSIDAQQAERLPGVHAVVTREHLGHLNLFLDPVSYGAEGEGAAPLIALERVRYEGEPVAVVAAETPALAQQALECIEVAYEDLPVLFDTREALTPDVPSIHAKHPSNLVGRFDFGWGDIEQGFRESDHIFEDTCVLQSVFHHPMENLGGCIAEVRGDTVELTAPIQHPFRSRDDIAAMYGFDRNKVRVRFPYVDGGFGSKELKTEHLIAILLAIRSGRAVTLRPTAEESFRSDCRHAVVYHVKTGVKADGTLMAQDIDLIFDKGAYAHGNGMNVPRRGSSLAWGPYRVPHLRVVVAPTTPTKSPLVPFAVSVERRPPGATSPTTIPSPASWISTRWRFAGTTSYTVASVSWRQWALSMRICTISSVAPSRPWIGTAAHSAWGRTPISSIPVPPQCAVGGSRRPSAMATPAPATPTWRSRRTTAASSGSCTVLVDGEPISACTYLAFEASGKCVTTIEGLAPEGYLDPLQEAFIQSGAAQCGFCTSGMLLAWKALLLAHPTPTREQIGRYLNGNICRCGAYVQILEAIQDVVEARQGDAAGLPWPPQGGHTSPDAAQANQP